MSRSITMPESLSAPSDKIIYQVGLNALRYQEIERIAKRLIEFSDYTVTSSDISKDKPTPISWSFNPSVNTTKNTMGSLVSLLCDLYDADENKESDDKIKDTLLPVFILTHWGRGRFVFWALASFRLTMKVLWAAICNRREIWT